MLDDPSFEPEGFGWRVRNALLAKGWDVKALQEAVRARYGNLLGSSYGSVWSYVNGKAPQEPRREVVEAMASLLDRPPRFLLFGEGPKTEREKVAQEAAVSVRGKPGKRRGKDFTAEDFREAVVEGFPALRRVPSLSASWGLISEVYGQYLALPLLSGTEVTRKTSKKQRISYYREAAINVGEMLGASAEAVGVDLSALSQWELEQYVQITAQALSVLLHGAFERWRQSMVGVEAEKRPARSKPNRQMKGQPRGGSDAEV